MGGTLLSVPARCQEVVVVCTARSRSREQSVEQWRGAGVVSLGCVVWSENLYAYIPPGLVWPELARPGQYWQALARPGQCQSYSAGILV